MMMIGNSYDCDALESKLRGMSRHELRKFWWDIVGYHNTPYPKYLRAVLRAANLEYARRLREAYCPVTKLHRAMAPHRIVHAH